MSRTSALGQFTLLPVLADAADITSVGTTMADRIEKYVNMRFATTVARDAAITVPEEGMHAYIGSNDSAEGDYHYHGTQWRLPWNMPWGRIGSATATAAQTGIGVGPTDLTSLTVTFTAVANRKYRIMGMVRVVQNTSNGANELSIRNSAGTVLNRSTKALNTASNNADTHNVFIEDGPAAGSTTYKLSLGTTVGTTDTQTSATQPGIIIVEDIGPNGAPS